VGIHLGSAISEPTHNSGIAQRDISSKEVEYVYVGALSQNSSN